MKDLLLAIQAELRRELTYIRDGDIFITPHLNYIPHVFKNAFVGIKDGRVTREELSGSMWRVTMRVKIASYVQLQKEEASIVGDEASGIKGVLEIPDDINAALDENLLGIDGMIEAYCSPVEEESETFGDEKEGLQRKIISVEYVKEVERA